MTAWGDLTGRGMRLQKLKMQPQKSEFSFAAGLG